MLLDNLYYFIKKQSYHSHQNTNFKKEFTPQQHVKNGYFLLNLKLPKPKDDIYPNPNYTTTDSVTKFGFLELLENIHNKDFHTNNPWFNATLTSNKDYWRNRHKKRVHFIQTEISSAVMPHCRRNGEFTRIVNGQLHTSICMNAAQESAEILGEHTWYNRVFILECCIQCPTSRTEFYYYES
jgi:hypothetical protein